MKIACWLSPNGSGASICSKLARRLDAVLTKRGEEQSCLTIVPTDPSDRL